MYVSICFSLCVFIVFSFLVLATLCCSISYWVWFDRGEGVERLPSYLGRFTAMSKEMTPLHRLDLLSDALLYYAIHKIDCMRNYIIWAATHNACTDLWSHSHTCSGKSHGLLSLLILLTAEKSWKMSTI